VFGVCHEIGHGVIPLRAPGPEQRPRISIASRSPQKIFGVARACTTGTAVPRPMESGPPTFASASSIAGRGRSPTVGCRPPGRTAARCQPGVRPQPGWPHHTRPHPALDGRTRTWCTGDIPWRSGTHATCARSRARSSSSSDRASSRATCLAGDDCDGSVRPAQRRATIGCGSPMSEPRAGSTTTPRLRLS